MVVLMRKLCLAVMVFSFLGYGPLQSFFHSNFEIKEKEISQNLKDKTEQLGEQWKIVQVLFNDFKKIVEK